MGIGVFMNKRPTTGELFATNQLITQKALKQWLKVQMMLSLQLEFWRLTIMKVLVNYKNVESSNIATTTIMPRIQFVSLAFRESFPSLNNQPTAQISNTPTNINIRCPIYRLYIQYIKLANSLNTAILP